MTAVFAVSPCESSPTLEAFGAGLMDRGGRMVGEWIAAARNSRGLSIDDVAEATKLRPLIIEGIEADDYSVSGGEAYVIGHLRMIAEVVGLDGDELIAEYRRG